MGKAGSQPGKTASGKNGFTFRVWVNSVIQITLSSSFPRAYTPMSPPPGCPGAHKERPQGHHKGPAMLGKVHVPIDSAANAPSKNPYT